MEQPWWTDRGKRPLLGFRPGLCRCLSAKHHTQLDRESRNACSAAFFVFPQTLTEIHREAMEWFEYRFLSLCFHSSVQNCRKRPSELSINTSSVSLLSSEYQVASSTLREKLWASKSLTTLFKCTCIMIHESERLYREFVNFRVNLPALWVEVINFPICWCWKSRIWNSNGCFFYLSNKG